MKYFCFGLILLAGCSHKYDDASKDYVNTHECDDGFSIIPNPMNAGDPLGTWEDSHAFTIFNCKDAAPIHIEFVDGRPWKPLWRRLK